MSEDPVPAYFSFRYIAWLAWTNMQTCLLTLSSVLALLTADESLLSHAQSHWILFAVGAFGIIASRIKQTPPPTKGP